VVLQVRIGAHVTFIQGFMLREDEKTGVYYVCSVVKLGDLDDYTCEIPQLANRFSTLADMRLYRGFRGADNSCAFPPQLISEFTATESGKEDM
jgi:hypothetical protein